MDRIQLQRRAVAEQGRSADQRNVVKMDDIKIVGCENASISALLSSGLPVCCVASGDSHLKGLVRVCTVIDGSEGASVALAWPPSAR